MNSSNIIVMVREGRGRGRELPPSALRCPTCPNLASSHTLRLALLPIQTFSFVFLNVGNVKLSLSLS